jgi:hypothetical protein
MQALHASQKHATASAETLATALREVGQVGGDIRRAMEDGRVGIDVVATKLQSLAETHEVVRASNQQLADSLRVLATEHVRAVATLGAEVDLTRQKLLSGIEGLSALQAKSSRFVGSLDAALHYTLFIAIVWFATTAPRLCESRFAMLLYGPVLSMLAERYSLRAVLKALSWVGLANDPDWILFRGATGSLGAEGAAAAAAAAAAGADAAASDPSAFAASGAFFGPDAHAAVLHLLDPTPLRNLFIGVAVAIGVAAIALYEHPDARHRRLMQIEIDAALRNVLNRAASVGSAHGDGSDDAGAGARRGGRALMPSIERSDDTAAAADAHDVGAVNKRSSSTRKRV